ncbi:MAG: hypothetical protein JO013_07540 [Alphaproteobacteria bacterium]|nr:hypothetical protein [Alphaproteobacteria bacterium]
MSMGAERAEPRAGWVETGTQASDWLGSAEAAEEADAPPPAAAKASVGTRAYAAILLLLALGWTGAALWYGWDSRVAQTPARLVPFAAFLSAPLALLGLLWLLFGRSSRRETERFTQAVEAMRSESVALETVLGIVAEKLEENHARLRGEAEKLMSLGDEAADRLGRVTYYLSKESAALDRRAAELEGAAAAAKVDIGVLMHDLPRAEEQARAVAEAMKDAGLTAHGQAGALEAQLAALAARGREADEVLGSAAQKMAAHVARIESSAETAATAMDQASAGMTAAVDGAMARAADALDAARAALEAQAAATLAAIERGGAELDRAGEAAAASLAARLDGVGATIDTLAATLAAQDAASRELVTGLAAEVAGLDEAFVTLARTGGETGESLARAVDAARSGSLAALEALAGGRGEADALLARTEALRAALGEVAGDIEGRVGPALAATEADAGRAAERLATLSDAADAAGAASRAIEERVGALAARVGETAAGLSAHDRSTRSLVEELTRDLAGLEESFAATHASGAAHAHVLGSAIADLREAATALATELEAGSGRAASLGARSSDIAGAMRETALRLDEELAPALARVEERSARTRDAAVALAPLIEATEAAATAALARVSESGDAVARQRESLDALLARIDEGAAGAEDRLRALGTAATEAQEAAAKIAADTGPELIDALLRVREAANQAALHARDAIAAVIPAGADALGDAARDALSRAVEEAVAREVAELAAVAEASVETARRASERLTRQMLSLGETTAAIEARIAEEKQRRDAQDSEQMSRRVALLIESLNSTAIDVTKILSNEVTDSAWAAYLKGDRGVFTRRAVRLLETSEAREIARHYEEEPEFREQVNRYVHDFEAMLRRILADRDGSPLGVTILSSDMGKLYVALAQAIERLR